MNGHIRDGSRVLGTLDQRIRRLAREFSELERLRDHLRRAEAMQKARGEFGAQERQGKGKRG